MSVEKIMEFLAAPQLPDIIAYFLLGVAFVRQFFIHRFVRKDNVLTVGKVDTRIKVLDRVQAEITAVTAAAQKDLGDAQKELGNAQKDLAEAIAAAKKERESFEKARQECAKEIEGFNDKLERIKEIVQYGFGSVDTLVKSGAANKIARLLHAEAEETEKINEIKETPAEAEESKEGI